MLMHFLLRYILFREHAPTGPPRVSRGPPDGPPVTLPMAWTPRNDRVAGWAANAKDIRKPEQDNLLRFILFGAVSTGAGTSACRLCS